MLWEDLYKTLNSINIIVVIICGFFFNIFMRPLFTFSFLIGAALALLNFHFMQKGIRSFFLKNGIFIGSKIALISKFYFRLAIIGIIIYILLGKNVDVIGLLLGLSIIMFGILILGIYHGIKFYRIDKKRG